jgi:apolipoprotein N-acyltransferase
LRDPCLNVHQFVSLGAAQHVSLGRGRFDRVATLSALAATFVAGWLYARAFPQADQPLLAWVALVPFLVAVRSGGPRRAALLGLVVMLTLAWGVNDWFPRAVSTYYLQPALVGLVFFVGVTTLTAAPATILFAVCYCALARHPRPWLPLAAAAAWAAGELGRTRLLGDPWALLGYSQIDATRLVQIAELTGVYGIGVLPLAVNAAAADVLVAGWRRDGSLRTALAGVGLVIALVAIVLLYGEVRLRQLAAEPEGAQHSVLLVQADLDLGSQWRPEFYGRNLEQHLRLTGEALAERGVDLVLWPESATTFFVEDEPIYRAAIAGVLKRYDAQLLTGGPRVGEPGAPVYHNTAFLMAPDGRLLGRYDKRRLLPFAEHFPVPRLNFLRRRFGRVREFTPGGPARLLDTSVGRAGVVICNEALFAAPSAARVRAGAELLVALTNDSWVGEPKYAAQAIAKTRLRAVEQRRWLLRASTSGPSAIVDPAGRVQAQRAFHSPGTLTGQIRRRSGVTPYGRFGDWFAGLCSFAAAGAWYGALRTARLSRGGDR